MRIIAGRWRSRRIDAPPGTLTRPTAGRSRETLFSMLASRLGDFDDLFVLDLFAGSGALALEALSRGVAGAALVEKDAGARLVIERNIRLLAANARLAGHDALNLPAAPAPADLVFVDPPYGEGLAEAALQSALRQGWIAAHSWIAVETRRGEALAAASFSTVAARAVGKAELRLLRPAT